MLQLHPWLWKYEKNSDGCNWHQVVLIKAAIERKKYKSLSKPSKEKEQEVLGRTRTFLASPPSEFCLSYFHNPGCSHNILGGFDFSGCLDFGVPLNFCVLLWHSWHRLLCCCCFLLAMGHEINCQNWTLLELLSVICQAPDGADIHMWQTCCRICMGLNF